MCILVAPFIILLRVPASVFVIVIGPQFSSFELSLSGLTNFIKFENIVSSIV